MARVQTGKWTHDLDGGVVVFLVGMRINKPLRVRGWLPAFRAMPRMLRELQADPSSGFLGATQALVRGGGLMVVTYWRDMESLIAYAHAQDHEHRPAWAAFNRAARDAGGAAGIWHETYVVPKGAHESLYVDMPTQGIVAATTPQQVTPRRESARSRMARVDAS